VSDAAAGARPSGSPLPLDDFDYDLPPVRIAQVPASPRDASRLMTLPRRSGGVGHHRFSDLPSLLQPGDLLVVNTTRVIPARLHVIKPSGGKVELLFVRALGGPLETAASWEVIGRPGKALTPGRRLVAPTGAELWVRGRDGPNATVASADGEPLWPLLQSHGELPLPPYIERAAPRAADQDDYQTLFAQTPGAVAAPTAALHFTPRLLQALEARGVSRTEVVLHVGPGTFLPVRPEHAADVRQHRMHAEYYDVGAAVGALGQARDQGRRIIAVGTTTVRALETWVHSGATVGSSELFITPGYDFGVVDGLITNFHLPRSTLLMLVSALAGRERVLAAYGEAIAAEYRFYSYGDAMLIL
jgi:S-adenosylmethionine:tRNA ribosyltransferase-isomerase